MATTAKKTVKKATKKVAKKAATKKTASAKLSPIKTSVKRVLSLQTLYKLNLVSAAVNLALAFAAKFALLPNTTDVTLSFVTKDQLASAQGTVLGGAYEVLATIELRYILTFIFAVSAIGSLLLASRLRGKYEAAVSNETSGLRWLLIGVTSAMLLEFVTILSGINDVMTLKLVAALVLVTALLGWISERENKGATTKRWFPFVISIFTGVLAWMPLIGSFAGTSIYGLERFGWHVYAVAGVLLAGFIAFAANQYMQIQGQKRSSNYVFVERNYLAIDILTKVAVGAVILIALHS